MTKKKLRRKMRKQKTTHLLAMSDLQIELDKLRYSLTFAEAKAGELAHRNERLEEELDHTIVELKKLLPVKDNTIPVSREREMEEAQRAIAHRVKEQLQ